MLQTQTIFKYFFLILVFAVAANAVAQSGIASLQVSGENGVENNSTQLRFADDLDTSFAPVLGRIEGSAGSLALQADGKIIVSGYFSILGGTIRRYLARLNADGTIDESFNPEISTSVQTVVLQPDGKILVAASSNAVNRNAIMRLNADGTLDTGFGAATISGMIYTLALQPDGKILIGGNFTNVAGVNRDCIARLNADGSFDPFFEPGGDFQGIAGYPPDVRTLFVQADGKILLAGQFSAINNINRNKFARLNADGSVDTGFAPLTGFQVSQGISALNEQPDGKILVGGNFSEFSGVPRSGLVRLNSDGTVDASFAPEGVTNPGKIYVLPGNKILVSGLSSNGITRFNADGSLDTSFNAASANFVNHYTGISGVGVAIIAILPDGKILAAGAGQDRRLRVVKLNSNGLLDTAFEITIGYFGTPSKILVQPDEKILVSGSFDIVGNNIQRILARLNSDGSPDPSFKLDPAFIINNSVPVAGSYIAGFAIQPDGKILIAGAMRMSGSNDIIGVARLNRDGSLDPSFALGVIRGNPSPVAGAVAVQSDGKIYVGGGYMTSYNGVNRNNFLRLNPDGTVDPTFTLQAAASSSITKIVIQPDGKVLISVYGGTGDFRGSLERVNPNSTIDSSWNGARFANQPVYDFALRPDGKIVVASFRQVIRVAADGSPDFGFGATTDQSVNTIALQKNGKVVIGGSFTIVNSQPRSSIVRLNENGTLDETFSVQATIGGTRAILNHLAMQEDGKILLGGNFRDVNNVARAGIARLNADSAACVCARTAFDYDGDGRADVSVWRPGNGAWYVSRSSNASLSSVSFGQTGDLIVPSDYDGDGKTDIAVARRVSAEHLVFYILQSKDNSYRFEQFGQPGDVPTVGDWDGDGRADLAVFRAAAQAGGQSSFYYRPSSQLGVDFRPIPWGTAGDKPVVADFDADGKQDAAVWRPSNGVWYILNSANNSFRAVQWGQVGDIPTAADFDGDGKADVSVFRPQNGTWYRLNSLTGQFVAAQFGVAEDRPVAADYDGDGRADLAVFRPSNNVWYLLRSQTGFTAQQFGASNDSPTPAAFLP